MHYARRQRSIQNSQKDTNLFDHVGTELLHREGANVSNELANHGVAEPVVVQIKNILHNLEVGVSGREGNNEAQSTHVVSIRVLHESQCVESNLSDKLDALRVGRMVNASLKDAAPMAVGRNFNTVRSNSIINKLDENK